MTQLTGDERAAYVQRMFTRIAATLRSDEPTHDRRTGHPLEEDGSSAGAAR
jgi:hypothetical protein